MKKNKSKKIIVFILLIALIGAGLLFYTRVVLYQKAGLSQRVTVIVPPGMTTAELIDTLNTKGIFEPGWYFNLACNAYSVYYGARIKEGTYRFSTDNTNLYIIRSIYSGNKLHIVRVTYPEGLTMGQFASLSANMIDIDSAEFIAYINSDSTRKKFGIKAKTAEGCLMPDTYEFFVTDKVGMVADKILGHHKKIWDSEFAADAAKKNKSRHDILTLASIIEAETSVADEMPRIAGVYLNRLRKGWKLEADPTVNYALGRKGRLYYADLKIDSPYNTYKYKGLPPGPINSPGRSAISAALNPEDHDYMFFVAKGDGSGRHFFAKTVAEHNRNKAVYKKNIGSR